MEKSVVWRQSQLENPQQATPRELDWVDRAGMFLSGLCAIHCLLTPLLMIFLPLAAEQFENPWVHIGMAVLVVPVGIFAFRNGYKHHHNARTYMLGFAGLALITVAAVMPALMEHTHWEEAITIAGSVFLLIAHYWNRKQIVAHCASGCRH